MQLAMAGSFNSLATLGQAFNASCLTSSMLHMLQKPGA